MARQHTTSSSIENKFSNLKLESPELFSPYTNSPSNASDEIDTTIIHTPLVSPDDPTASLSSTIREEYQVRTIGTHNIARLSILPIYPPFSLSPTPNTAATTTTSSRTPNLLMANVPSNIYLIKDSFFFL